MDECIFCKIARHEILTQAVYEDDRIIAFKDLKPVAPIHILIVPKRHIPELTAIDEGDKNLIGDVFLVAKKLALETNISDDGFRVVVNQGKNAGQSVPHLHFHLLGGRLMGWPPG